MTKKTHHGCSTHATYRMSCDEYDALRARAGGRCEVCSTTNKRVVIDHDHALGLAAVRGMVCDLCNRSLGRVDAGAASPSPHEQAYLLNAWHRWRPIEFVPDNRATGRKFRVHDSLWEAAMELAKKRRTTVSQILKSALVVYTERYATDEERERAAREADQ